MYQYTFICFVYVRGAYMYTYKFRVCNELVKKLLKHSYLFQLQARDSHQVWFKIFFYLMFRCHCHIVSAPIRLIYLSNFHVQSSYHIYTWRKLLWCLYFCLFCYIKGTPFLLSVVRLWSWTLILFDFIHCRSNEK